MIASVELQSASWNELPWKFEAGTPMIAEAVGLAAPSSTCDRLGMERVREHELALTAQMLEGPGRGARPARRRAARGRGRAAAWPPSRSRACTPTTSPSWPDREGVCIRAGHHCAQPLMRCLGVGATARASVGVYNDHADIDALVQALLGSPRGLRRSRVHDVDDLYRDYILDHYKRPRNFGELRSPRPRGGRAQPALRRRAGRAHPRQGRPDRGPPLPRPRLRDLAGGRLDRLGGAEGHEARRGRRAGRRLDDRAAGHPRLGHAAQVRAAEPEGRPRRRHGGPRVAP